MFIETKVKCILLKSVVYHILDSETGDETEGISLMYIPCDNLLFMKTESNFEGEAYEAVKVSVPYAQLENIKGVPALYELTFKTTVNRDGKPVIKPVSLEFLRKLNVVSLAEKK